MWFRNGEALRSAELMSEILGRRFGRVGRAEASPTLGERHSLMKTKRRCKGAGVGDDRTFGACLSVAVQLSVAQEVAEALGLSVTAGF